MGRKAPEYVTISYSKPSGLYVLNHSETWNPNQRMSRYMKAKNTSMYGLPPSDYGLPNPVIIEYLCLEEG